VLITGASGGVGSGLIQLCRARGAIPYAIVGTGKEQAVTAIGAEAVIARETDDLVGAVNKATGGKPIDIVADLVAGWLLNDLLRILRPGAVTPRRCDRREGAQMIELDRARYMGEQVAKVAGRLSAGGTIHEARIGESPQGQQAARVSPTAFEALNVPFSGLHIRSHVPVRCVPHILRASIAGSYGSGPHQTGIARPLTRLTRTAS
jgi:NAD(P)-dependent dehydrogenase (short-subunit alcohol dehydrogenase family)